MKVITKRRLIDKADTKNKLVMVIIFPPNIQQLYPSLVDGLNC